MEKKLSKVGKNLNHVFRIEIISQKKLKNIEEIKDLILMETDERVRFYEGYIETNEEDNG